LSRSADGLRRLPYFQLNPHAGMRQHVDQGVEAELVDLPRIRSLRRGCDTPNFFAASRWETPRAMSLTRDIN
jgi:hypothetical protein